MASQKISLLIMGTAEISFVLLDKFLPLFTFIFLG